MAIIYALLWTLSFFLCNTYITVSASTITDNNETLLLEKLLSNYNPRARPATHVNDSVQVELAMHILKLQEVSTKYQFISVLGWINAYWYDPRLTWDPEEYGGLDYIGIPAPDLWLPTFVLANSASDHLYNEFWYSLFKVMVSSDGRLKWTPGGIFQADCPIDVHFFPFDEQICQFRFENWVYMGDKVNLTFTPTAAETMLQFYSIKNGQWDILDVAVFRRDKYFFDTNPYPRVHFGIHLRRKSLFYVTNIILLSMMLAVLVLFIFKLPAESGERVSMGVTLLLAFSVFILMINDSIPETSSAVPIIIVYLISFMGLTTLGICESVFILYCYHHNGKKSPPHFIRYIFFKLIPGDKLKLRGNSNQTSKKNNNVNDNSVNQVMDGKNDCEMATRHRKHSSLSDNRDITKNGADKELSKNSCDEPSPEESIIEWQDLSRNIDIFCFWLFLVMFLLLVLVLLVFVPVSFSDKNIEKAVAQWQNT